MNMFEVMGRLTVAHVTKAVNDKADILMHMRPLVKRYHRMCGAVCNGEGVIRGKGFVRCDSPAGYAPDGETTLFSLECEKLELKMCELMRGFGYGYRLKFQGDPRGWTVRIERKFGGKEWREDQRLSEILWE